MGNKAIISFILGIICLTPILIWNGLDYFFYFPMVFGIVHVLVNFGLPILLGIPGLIFGISGLKSTKRNFAIAGITFCTISLLVSLYYFLFY